MAYIFNNQNIKEKRVNNFIVKLYDSITKLLVLEERAEQLVDKDALSAEITSLSGGLLPFGDELVLNWNIAFDYESLSKFYDLQFNAATTNTSQEIIYDKEKTSVLQPAYADIGEVSTSEIAILPLTKAKLKNGSTYFPKLESYDFDYTSYEIINEMYRAVVLILNSVESFYSNFQYIPITEVEGVYDDSFRKGQYVIVYDTAAMDSEIDGRIYEQAQLIADPVDRETVMQLYRITRDNIKFFCMEDVAIKLEAYIEQLLFCVNGVKNYDIKFNQDLRALIVQAVPGSTNGEYIIKQHQEEVFFPFHNKAFLDQFSVGIKALW